MGFFYGLNREDYDREYSDRELIQRIYTYFVPHSSRIIVVGLLTVALSMMNVVPRVVIARSLDRLVLDPQKLDVLLLMVGVVLLGGVVEWGGELGATLPACPNHWSDNSNIAAGRVRGQHAARYVILRRIPIWQHYQPDNFGYGRIFSSSTACY